METFCEQLPPTPLIQPQWRPPADPASRNRGNFGTTWASGACAQQFAEFGGSGATSYAVACRQEAQTRLLAWREPVHILWENNDCK